MNVNEIKSTLQLSLSKDLPGEKAHLKMAPLSRKLLPSNKVVPKQSAVLILITITTTPAIVLIQRPTYNGVHSNQIALPGGKIEFSDNSLLDTAQRETLEEIGVNKNQYDVLGELSTIYIPPSNFYVTPFVAIANQTLHYTLEEKEVDEIIELPVNQLLNNNIKKEQVIPMSPGLNLKTMTYLHTGKTIWGATAMILSELEYLLINK